MKRCALGWPELEWRLTGDPLEPKLVDMKLVVGLDE